MALQNVGLALLARFLALEAEGLSSLDLQSLVIHLSGFSPLDYHAVCNILQL